MNKDKLWHLDAVGKLAIRTIRWLRLAGPSGIYRAPLGFDSPTHYRIWKELRADSIRQLGGEEEYYRWLARNSREGKGHHA